MKKNAILHILIIPLMLAIFTSGCKDEGGETINCETCHFELLEMIDSIALVDCKYHKLSDVDRIRNNCEDENVFLGYISEKCHAGEAISISICMDKDMYEPLSNLTHKAPIVIQGLSLFFGPTVDVEIRHSGETYTHQFLDLSGDSVHYNAGTFYEGENVSFSVFDTQGNLITSDKVTFTFERNYDNIKNNRLREITVIYDITTDEVLAGPTNWD